MAKDKRSKHDPEALLEQLDAIPKDSKRRKYDKEQQRLRDAIAAMPVEERFRFRFSHREALSEHNMFRPFMMEFEAAIEAGLDDLAKEVYQDNLDHMNAIDYFDDHATLYPKALEFVLQKVPDKYKEYRAFGEAMTQRQQHNFDTIVQNHPVYSVIQDILTQQDLEVSISIPIQSSKGLDKALSRWLGEFLGNDEDFCNIQTLAAVYSYYEAHDIADQFGVLLDEFPYSQSVFAPVIGALHIEDIEHTLEHYDLFRSQGEKYERYHSILLLRQHIESFDRTETGVEYINHCIHVLNQGGMFKESNDLPIRNHIRNNVWDPVRYATGGQPPHWDDPVILFWMLTYTILYSTRALDNTTMYEFRDSFQTIDTLTERLIVLLGEEWSEHIKRIVEFEYGHLYYRAQNNPYYDEWYPQDRKELATIHKDVTHKLKYM